MVKLKHVESVVKPGRNIMKAVCIEIPTGYPLTIGKVYDIETTPIMYDKNTFQPQIGHIIKCDDGKFRKIGSSPLETGSGLSYPHLERCFISIQDMRDSKLESIGI